jgi:hypothetical protein
MDPTDTQTLSFPLLGTLTEAQRMELAEYAPFTEQPTFWMFLAQAVPKYAAALHRSLLLKQLRANQPPRAMTMEDRGTTGDRPRSGYTTPLKSYSTDNIGAAAAGASTGTVIANKHPRASGSGSGSYSYLSSMFSSMSFRAVRAVSSVDTLSQSGSGASRTASTSTEDFSVDPSSIDNMI